MKVVFLCGHHSPYGRAHLEPIFNSKFEIIALVLATDARWAYFYSILSGKPIQNFKQQNAKFRVKQAVKHILTKLPGNFELKRNSLQNKYLDRYSEQEIVQLFEKYAVTSKYEFDINSEAFVAWVRSQEPDLIISAAYPQILKKSLLEIQSDAAYLDIKVFLYFIFREAGVFLYPGNNLFYRYVQHDKNLLLVILKICMFEFKLI